MYVVLYLCALLFVTTMALFVYRITSYERAMHPRRLHKTSTHYETLLASSVATGDYCLRRREVRRLRHTINLEAFCQALKGLSRDQRRRVLLYNQEQIVCLQRREADTTIHAYFAYLLCILSPFDGNQGAYGELMLSFLCDDSVYARENALKAIYSFGDAQLVSDALTSLSARGISHNEKLVADGLLTFGGDVEQLTELLMDHYDELLECYKNALITYMSHKSINTYDSKLFDDAMSQGATTDTVCAVIRKVNKCPSERNLELLKNLVERYQNSDAWEPVAIAASGLGTYVGNDDAKALLKGMVTSPNWYIRKNSAAALASLGLTQDDIHEIYAQNDTFAKDAISYEVGRYSNA